MRVVVLNADELCFLFERPLRRQVFRDGGRAQRDRARCRACRGRAPGRPGKRVYACSESRSPRWGERNASPRRATQNVFFSSAPTATIERLPEWSCSGSGVYPRDRRIGKAVRTTESSHRRWIGRSWARKASAIPPSRARASPSSNAIGSSEMFPLVSTNELPRSAASKWWRGVYGSMTPSHGDPGAIEAATGAPLRLRASTIGRSRERSNVHSAARDLAQLVRCRRHHRERLLLAPLAGAQPRHCVLVRGVAGQVVAAQALDGEDGSRAQQRHGFLQRHREARPAGGTRDRLRMEAPIGGVLVLAAAVGAHRESGHRRVRPVVRDGPDDREAGPALRAVDERVAEAAVVRIEELPKTVVARGHVRRHDRGAVRRPARGDLEALVAPGPHRLAVTVSTCASAGASPISEAAKESSAAGSPSASITTPSPSFKTKPASRLRPASRCTKGRKPTPCTTPRTRNRRRSLMTTVVASPLQPCDAQGTAGNPRSSYASSPM